MTLQTDKPMPAFLTINETALLLRGADEQGKPTTAGKNMVRRLIRNKQLRIMKRKCGGAGGETIYIKATSLRDFIS